MIGRLEALIKEQDFDSAIRVIPSLKGLFHEQNEIFRTIDDLEHLLDKHSPDCQKKLDDLKHLMVA